MESDNGEARNPHEIAIRDVDLEAIRERASDTLEKWDILAAQSDREVLLDLVDTLVGRSGPTE